MLPCKHPIRQKDGLSPTRGLRPASRPKSTVDAAGQRTFSGAAESYGYALMSVCLRNLEAGQQQRGPGLRKNGPLGLSVEGRPGSAEAPTSLPLSGPASEHCPDRCRRTRSDFVRPSYLPEVIRHVSMRRRNSGGQLTQIFLELDRVAVLLGKVAVLLRNVAVLLRNVAEVLRNAAEILRNGAVLLRNAAALLREVAVLR